MNNSLLTATLMMGAAAFFSPLCKAVPAVYPTPQFNQLNEAKTRITHTDIRLREPDSSGGMWDKMPADNAEAYALEIKDGGLTIHANSDTALYYAKQTISQLQGQTGAQRDPYPDLDIDAVARKGELPEGVLIDWPDLPFRGVVEGYYGIPWSFEARQSQFDFYGRNKMNTYIYAPKDDPYHHGQGCYQPYPEEKAKEISALVKSARSRHVRFVWAIHPANTVKWEENGGREQLDALCHKLQLMYELGVRDFGVLVDDSRGEIGRPERQVELCNYILENFIRKHPDVNQTLIMCPTGYNRAWTNPGFLQTIGDGFDKSIPVMWTGDTVVHDITLAGQQWVNGYVQRPTFIWWNWPCNDFKRGRLSMGRTYGLDTSAEMKRQMSGFVSNPMEHAEASKIGLFGVADYTWNITAFRSKANWRDGIARLYPGCAEAMQVFCNHNSYLLPNNHGYFREESVDMEAAASAFRQSLEKEHPDTQSAALLRDEFQRMEKAGRELASASGISAFQKDAAPWIRQFTLAGQVGTAIIDSLLSRDEDARMKHFFNAVDAISAMKRVTRTDWNGGRFTQEHDVETAMGTMMPVAKEAFRHVNAEIYARLAGLAYAMPVFSSNTGRPEEGARAMMDGNMDTFWSSETAQQEGQWFQLDFGQATVIRNVVLLMGGKRAKDYARSGQFEISMDGEDWLEIGHEMGGNTVVFNLSKHPVRARYLRYRITTPCPNWTSICVFAANVTPPNYVISNMAWRPDFSVSQDDRIVRINRVMEVFPIRPGEFIELDLSTPILPEWIEINVEDEEVEDWGRLELTLSNGRRVQVKGQTIQNRLYLKKESLPKGAVSALRLTNASEQIKEIKLTLFRLGLPPCQPEKDPAALTDGNLATFFDCGQAELETSLPLPEGTKEAIIVGTADCAIPSAEPGKRTMHLQHFTLPENAKEITIKAPVQPGKSVHEVIYK